jgi:hypothetical protein
MNSTPSVGADLSTPERILLFCLASGTEWAEAGMTGATVTRMTVRGLIDRDGAERLVLTPMAARSSTRYSTTAEGAAHANAGRGFVREARGASWHSAACGTGSRGRCQSGT